MGPAGEPGMGLIYQGILEMDEGDSRSGASLREFCEGNLVGSLHYWGPQKICRKGSGSEASLSLRELFEGNLRGAPLLVAPKIC